MKKAVYRLILVAVLAGAGYAAWRYIQKMPSRHATLPTTRVRQGDVVVRSFTRGELRATRTATLTAPNLFGTVQVTRLAPLGSFAREKDLIVEFDDSEVQSRLEQTQLQMEQLDEQIKKAQADLNIRNNQDQVDLLRANYAVRRAELEVKRNELLATIDQKKNLLNLEEAKRRLDQLKSDIKSKQEQAVAEIAVLRERRNRSMLDINREKMRLAQVKLLAPISGLVAIRQNRSGFSGMFGTTVPDIREGDQVPPGSPVTDVLDLSELEVIARVGEIDRANLKEGQDVLIRLDALPEKTFDGKIKSMSGTASANLFSSDPGKKFDVVFSIDMRQLLTSLGAKPDQIARILATAEINRKKPIAQPMTSMLGMGGIPGAGGMAGGGMPGGGMPGGGMPGGGMPGGGMPGGAMAGGATPGGAAPGAGGFGGGTMTPEQQQKMREAFQKATGGKNIQDMTPEERQAVFAKMRETMQAAQKADDKKSGDKKAGEKKADGQPAAEGDRSARREGRGSGPGGPGGGPGMMPSPNLGPYTQAELDKAQLPSPPGEGDQLEVLLRPGLLADVEIIIEKVPNAVYLPNQSIFDKNGKLTVFVRSGNKWEPREVKLSKRSESVSIIESGVKPGDIVAVSDPTETSSDKKKADKKATEGSGGAAGALPGAAAKGGQ
jgi:HlyD family secretion protein